MMTNDIVAKAKELLKEETTKGYYSTQYHEATVSFQIGISTGR